MQFSYPFARSDNPNEWKKGAPWRDFIFQEQGKPAIEGEVCSMACLNAWLDGILAKIDKKWD